MPILKLSPEAIDEAARHIRAGGLVGAPTETVYGLFGDATLGRSAAAIFDIKGRPRISPLIVHVKDFADAQEFAVFDRRAAYLAQRLWPGPLTLVLKQKKDSPIAALVTAGLDTVAVRVPDNPTALQLLEAVGRPLAAPSANRYGQVSPTEATHVDEQFGRSLSIILDGGPTKFGVESTIVDLSSPDAVLLRPGGYATEVVEASIGELKRPDHSMAGRSPGSARSHYAPRATLRLEVETACEEGRLEGLLAFGSDVPEGYAEVLNLSPSGDVKEAAANLFAFIRLLDKPELEGIAVMPIPERNLGIAINDRLRRAAAPRG